MRRRPRRSLGFTRQGAPTTRVVAGKRALDVALTVPLLLLALPVVLLLAAVIKIESRGPFLYRCRRVGMGGREFDMLKFRKMRRDAAGPALTSRDDTRFTRVGRFLALSKLDELPQLWNVLKGDMSLVGPRPEDPSFVALEPAFYETILSVRPGITGLTQLAFARECDILDDGDREGDYVARLLPAKAQLDRLYVARRSAALDLRILVWTVIAVLVRRDVAVNRETAGLGVRAPRRRREAEAHAFGRAAAR